MHIHGDAQALRIRSTFLPGKGRKEEDKGENRGKRKQKRLREAVLFVADPSSWPVSRVYAWTTCGHFEFSYYTIIPYVNASKKDRERERENDREKKRKKKV